MPNPMTVRGALQAATLAAGTQQGLADGGRTVASWLVTGECFFSVDADSHDINPDGWDGGSVIYLTSGAPWTFMVTGLAGGTNGRMAIIYNLANYTFVLPSESPGSTAGNRFYMPGGNINLAPAECAVFRYYDTTSVWKLLTLLGRVGTAGVSRRLVGNHTIEAGGCLIVSDEITVEIGSDLTIEQDADLQIIP